MEENIVDMKTLRKKNMRIFWLGAVLSILASLPLTCAALYWFVLYKYEKISGYRTSYGNYFVDALNDASRGGGLNIIVTPVLWYIEFLIIVVLIQICIYFGIRKYTSRNKEISGTKMWVFYAIELLVALTPFLIIWASNYV